MMSFCASVPHHSSLRTHNDLLLLASDLSDNEALVLRSQEDLVAVQTKEGLGGVLASDLLVVENSLTSGVAGRASSEEATASQSSQHYIVSCHQLSRITRTYRAANLDKS